MMNSKPAYFDSQVESDWASKDYTEDELAKINRMLRLARWRPEVRILEPGCGTGRLTEVLSDLAGDSGSILATDISPKMVEASLKRLGERENVRVECAAVEDSAIGKGEFDLIICHQVFPHFDDKRLALRFFARCLKPLGRLVLMHFIDSAEINDRHRKIHPAVAHDAMPSSEEMMSMLHVAGFRIELLEDDDKGYLLIASR